MSNIAFSLGGINALEHVPATAGKLPVLVMLPGKGETGTDKSKILINGPSKFIQDGWDPQNWIIVSAQPIGEWSNPQYVDNIVNAVITRYKDKSDGRLFLTGLSAGAYAIENYIGKSPEYSKKVTGIVSMSAPPPAPYYNAANFNQPAWGFCGTKDSFYNKMKDRYTGKKFTSYPDGHAGWNTFYDPKFKENGLSIYEFLDAIKPAVITPPVEVKPKEVQILPDAEGKVYASAKTYNVLPGDTIVLKGNYQSFFLKDVVGAPGKMINVVADGMVTIGGYKAYAQIFENSSYFNIFGLTPRGGIVIDGGTTGTKSPGIAINKSHHFNIDGLAITNVSAGIMIKTTPKDETPGTYESDTDPFCYDTINISNCNIYNVTGEGMYIGCSTSTKMQVGVEGVIKEVYAYRVKNIRIINNKLRNTGWDGIQATCCDGVFIDGNDIDTYGVAGVGYQGYGIICAGNLAIITNNRVANGKATGITGSFNGECEIGWNKVINAYGDGQDAIYANAHPIKDYGKFKPNIHDNYIENCKRNAIRVANTDGFEIPGVIKDNKYKNALMVVDESGSLLSNNVEVKDPATPTEPQPQLYPVAVLMSDGKQLPVAKDALPLA